MLHLFPQKEVLGYWGWGCGIRDWRDHHTIDGKDPIAESWIRMDYEGYGACHAGVLGRDKPDYETQVKTEKSREFGRVGCI